MQSSPFCVNNKQQAQVVQQNKSLQESIKENYTSFQAGYAEMVLCFFC